MRYVVGYGPRQRGVDGVNLAATLARSSGATLDLVAVLPSDAPTFHMYSPDHAFNAEVEEQGREWLEDGLAHVPEDVQAEGHLRRAESITEGLLEAATDPDRGEAGMIVVGTYHRVRSGRSDWAASPTHCCTPRRCRSLSPRPDTRAIRHHPHHLRDRGATGTPRTCSTRRSAWRPSGRSRCA